MALQLVPHFDLQVDVLRWLRAGTEGRGEGVLEPNYESLHVLNVERNGNIIYTYKDDKGNVIFGLHDCRTRQNEHLYTFEKDLQAVSCSVNSERTLLAASLVQYTKEGVRNELQPGSKCLTLLVEIYPVNNVKVLKAVDSCIWVQFLYPYAESQPLPQNHLLLISEEKYIERYHIQITQEDGNRVVIKNSGHLPRDRIAEDFVWAQWDMSEQRLYYIDIKKSTSILKCIQFCADESFNLMFEISLDITLSDSGFKLVNFGCDTCQGQEKFGNHQPSLCVFTNHTGSLCVCYSPKSDSWEQITYSVFYLHKGYSKTFTAALRSADSCVTKGITFLNIGYYVAVYLPGHFLHLLNIQHPDLICHSLFLTGNNKMINILPHHPLQSLTGSLILDRCSGKLYKAFLNQSDLMWFLWNSSLDCEKMAALHCVLSCGRDPGFLEGQIIQWISEHVSTCHSFDLIQEFLIASSYWSIYPESSNIDTLLPYSSVLTWNTEIPGITLVTDEISLPLMKLDLICCLLETSWRKHSVHPWVLHLDRRGSAADFEVFHLMTRILEATDSLCLPLPPGFHSLHTILGVHCLPLHNLLHYIDNGVLRLTETTVVRLMKDLDNTEKNEKLKFGIIMRLPPLIGKKICRLWDHPVSSNIISRKHVTRLLQNYKKEPRNSMIDKSSFPIEFLPLNYFIEILTDLESSNQALYDFEGHDSVDAEFVEEAALKHTAMLLGL
ncbi:gamma-secretase-activating protein isoform X5 [Nannospalax galili]|uniref:gamma-secretase-activating protein isoform X5 n=1 Tax=Nannospalax galili TaxID=1026970 RepID=UPI00111C11AA|nr:gamma-secretase-activating protein isoform X5 [Nannospalax galili]